MDEERYSAVGKSRLDFITDKLLEIASDLKSIVAVHDNRLSTIEKFIVERKAEEFHQKEQIDERIEAIHQKIEEIDKNNRNSHAEFNASVSKLQRYLWVCIGGGTVLLWIMLNLSDIIHFIQLFAKMV